MYREINACRCCKSEDIADVFSLGEQWLTDFPPLGHEKDGILCPLTLVLCSSCGLVQLRHTIDQNEIYDRPIYWYKSGINQTMRGALKDVVTKAMAIAKPKPNDIVIDIGSNDGTLAAFYPDSLCKIGFEPSHNVYQESLDKVDWQLIYNDYFHWAGWPAKIITSCAMFYDLDDPHIFLEDIRETLEPDGLWIDQQNYLGSMVENLSFDNISHEHLGYYSFGVFEHLLAQHGLRVIDVEINGVNGGSFRSYVCKEGSTLKPFSGASERLEAIRQKEIDLALCDPAVYKAFENHANNIRSKLYSFISSEKRRGKTIYIYGASTRGQVILQFCNLGTDLISGAAERNPDKYGRVTAGFGIPIYDEEYVRAQKPDYMLVLPYSFKGEFIEREKAYLEGSGAFIFPLPEVEVVKASGRYLL